MSVCILPTGKTEYYGFEQAFDALFPGVGAYCVPSSQEIASYPDAFPLHGFTSSKLTKAHETTPPAAALELVERAAQAALGTRDQSAADLVLIIDDLELANADQPGRVVRVMRAAAEQHLQSIHNEGVRNRTATALRNKVSFHLLAPMVEAYFFADPKALRRAGVPTGTPVVFADETDPEAFLTDDPAYLAATEADCPCWAGLPTRRREQRKRKRQSRPKWLGDSDRRHHPKGYLQWLCRAPAEKSCTDYAETSRRGDGPSGSAALANLDWATLFARSPGQLQLLWALVEDVEQELGPSSVFGPVTAPCSPLTSRTQLPAYPVLRNL